MVFNRSHNQICPVVHHRLVLLEQVSLIDSGGAVRSDRAVSVDLRDEVLVVKRDWLDRFVYATQYSPPL